MSTISNVIKTILLLTIFSSSFAEVQEVDSLQYDNESHESIISPTDPDLKWQKYLLEKGIREGTNERPDGKVFLIAYGSSIVAKALDDSGWVRNRTMAYNEAILEAKSNMAEFLSLELKSNRAFLLESFGNEAAPPLVEAMAKPLSIMDKASTLTGLALDNEIKKFDADWDGTNKTNEERNVRLAAQRKLITLELSSKARAFLQGTTPIFNAEGPDDEGQYYVSVGIVWSPRSTLVAESIYNPTIAPPSGPKKALSVQDRIVALSDEELAGTLGLRIWWDQDGLPVIVSFGQASGAGFKAVAKKTSGLIAQAQITQFIAEQIASETYFSAKQDTRFYKDNDSFEAFDESKFNALIEANSKVVLIQGLGTIHYKKMKHPISNQKIVVNVMAWSPASNKLARKLKTLSDDQETKMNATKGGAIFVDSQEITDNSSGGAVATTGLEGVSSDPDEF
jgi:hypothetical protein